MGVRRVHGELLVLGVKVAPSTVWEILKEAGIDPAPGRAATTWASFLCSQAEALVACDFFETVTLSGARVFVLAVIEHHTRRIRVLGATALPTASWVAQERVRSCRLSCPDEIIGKDKVGAQPVHRMPLACGDTLSAPPATVICS